MMFPTVMTIVRFLYGPNTDMISQGIAQINKFLKVTFGERSRAFKAGRLILRLKPAEIRERIKRSVLRREAKNKVRKQVSFRVIKKMVGDLLESQELIDRIIIVATACGARLTEILVLSSFRAADDKNIAILRQAKERLSKGDIGRSIIKPVLFIKAPELEKRVRSIREQLERDAKLKQKTRRELTVHFDNRVNKRLREFLGKQFRFHDLRAIYGAISYERYGEDESLAAWLQEVLGHARGNIAASLAYSTVRLIE
jgi:integrase